MPPVPPALPDLAVREVAPGTEIVRCHAHVWGSTEFNPAAGSARFRPVLDGATVVPTIYGSDTLSGALSETVFHDVVPTDPQPSILRAELVPRCVSTVCPTRALRLADLTDTAIAAAGLPAHGLVDSPPSGYPQTVPWGQAIYDHPRTGFDGIVWNARQDRRSIVVLLWGTRVSRSTDLAPSTTRSTLPLSHGEGYERVVAIAMRRNIAIVV